MGLFLARTGVLRIGFLGESHSAVLPLHVPVEQGLLGLKPASQAHEDRVHILAFLGVLCRCLKEQHVVGVGKLERRVGGHLDLTDQVTFIPDQDPGHSGRNAMAVALLDPGLQILKGGHLGDIINEDDSMDVTIVVLHHALPEPLLASCVPDLYLQSGGQT